MHARKNHKRRKTIWMVYDKMQVQGPFCISWKMKDLHGTNTYTSIPMHGHRSILVMLSRALNRLNQLSLRDKMQGGKQKRKKKRKNAGYQTHGRARTLCGRAFGHSNLKTHLFNASLVV